MIGSDTRATRVVRGIVLAFCIATLATVALAQPTPEPRSSIRNACGEDFMANCSGIQPGGAEALACLQQNLARLSPSCQSAVTAVAPPAAASPPPAAATGPQSTPPPVTTPSPSTGAPSQGPTRSSSQQRAAIRTACRSDFVTYCGGGQPGGVEALACLKNNAANLSPICRQAVAAIAGGSTAARAPAGGAAPPPNAAIPQPMPPLPPIAELIIRRRCRADILTICPLPPGGGRMIECLMANTPSLTPRCQGALAEARAMAR